MTLIRKLLSGIQGKSVFSITKEFHMSCVNQLDQKWRKEQRLSRNPNSFGPLTNLPDYSFADGRTVPFGTRLYNRIKKQREHLAKIRQLTSEVDYAVERHAKMQKSIEEKRRNIISSKFKPKGQQLLDEKTTKST